MSATATIAAVAAMFSAVENMLTAILETRKALQQSGEWTAEQETEFDRVRQLAYQTNAFKTDAQIEAEKNAATGGVAESPHHP